ncbi:glycosyltransferase [Geomonas subterranea]|uniref:Glycosyltransferase n=1 Tax=Geomonas subterranea TaxID=2847989 RepID=A0ABX8LEY5_9BACT|nr:glycosyltransferase [Geomonas subterranea]QXE90606.1 glycosyltransferase [Geomonas subterranea]QXM11314.1 glycosyltransferase [Geomonas subterranea]
MSERRTAATVSVIIAAYNAEKYIAHAVDSVLAQSYPCVECIVVDDGSTDGTAEIVKGYGSRVRYLYQQNAERSAARNNGMREARGELISFLDADDLLAPEKLAEQAAFLAEHPEYDVAYSRVSYFNDKDGSSFTPQRRTPSGDIVADLLYGNFITIHSPLIRRDAALRGGGFDPACNRYEDWDFLLRLALAGAKFGFQDRLHAKVRLHPGNTIGDQVKMFEAKLRVAERIAEVYAAELKRRSVDVRGLVAFHQADYGRILVLAGRGAEGRALIREAVRIPFPNRKIFVVFGLAAGLFGSGILVAAQQLYDRVVKGKRAAKGGSA